MMHFFRRSKLHLDVFTKRRDVIEYAPVVNAIECIPDWWKALPKERKAPYPIPTMKTCVGVHDYYNRSIAMPLWSDLYVRIENRNYTWQFSDKITEAVIHPAHQYEGFVNADYGHLKIESPWIFNTKDDVNWVMTAPVYNRSCFDDFIMAEGVLNFSKQKATNIQLFLPVRTDRELTIPFKTMFMFTPMTDKKVVVHRHLVSEEEFNSRQSTFVVSTFINKYKAHQKIAKCPYKDFLK